VVCACTTRVEEEQFAAESNANQLPEERNGAENLAQLPFITISFPLCQGVFLNQFHLRQARVRQFWQTLRFFYNFPPMSESTVKTAEPVAASGPLDISQIQAILPHRFPFLLIDRVVEIERMKRIVAIKNVTINEPFFQGHFPGYPIMPGVLMVEAMAQAGGTLLLTEIPDRNDKLMVFTGIEKARFRRPVSPGDQLRIEVEVLAWRRIAVRMGGKAYVDGKVACEATISCALVDRSSGRIAESGSSE